MAQEFQDSKASEVAILRRRRGLLYNEQSVVSALAVDDESDFKIHVATVGAHPSALDV